MINQSTEYLNGLLKIGKWNYQVSISTDYKISYSLPEDKNFENYLYE